MFTQSGKVGPSVIAKYPFLKAGKEILKDAAVNERSLSLAKERVLAALAKRRPVASLEPKEKLASFALAKCMLACLHDRFVAKKWASREASEMAAQLAEEDSIVFESVAREIFPSLSYDASSKKYAINVFDYLNCGSNLVYENLERGKVFFDRGGLIRLLEEAVVLRLSDVEAINTRQLPKEVTEAAKRLEAELPKERIAGFAGSYLSLPCMQAVSKGVEEGKRYYGAMSLAVACLKDKLSIEQAREVMNNYAAKCLKATHSFTPREATNVLEWVYRRGTAGFSCKRLKDEGLAGEELCSTCVKRNKAGW